MMKSNCELNQCLQEAFFRREGAEPDTLPVFVSVEEAGISIAGEALCKLSFIPVESHCYSLMDGTRVNAGR